MDQELRSLCMSICKLSPSDLAGTLTLSPDDEHIYLQMDTQAAVIIPNVMH